MKTLKQNKFVRSVIFAILDAICIYMSGVIALYIRFEFTINVDFIRFVALHKTMAIYYIIIGLIIFYLFKMYSTVWSLAGFREALEIVAAAFILSLLEIVLNTMLYVKQPRSYYVLGFMVLALMIGVIRFSYRFYIMLKRSVMSTDKNIMIIGAGSAGTMLLNEIRMSNHINAKVRVFIDDNKNKIGKNLNGVPIVGDRYSIISNVDKYKIDEIYLAIPTASGKDRKAIIDIASNTGKKIKVLPGIFQLMNGEVNVSRLRDVDIEDLLGRDSIKINTNEILDFVENKIVLVTGAGGSIGSEICRQIARHNPAKLIMLDIYENSIYDIQLELKRHFPNLHIEVLIASVRDIERIDEIFAMYKPEIVFHAAAHKHVPLMEDSPCEAIKNNCFGTFNVASIADKYNVKKFILISTDKAVNPTNVMGASKRICEMIMEHFASYSKTTFALVRFGNVLGSNGSVVPLFKKEIEEGGPVTVTDPNVIRYFMTIPEAVALVLQAGAYARGGEIFILDMGEPVKIYDMAKKLIKLSGYEPDVDIEIKFTGLRKGEKLYEELLMSEENMQKTANNRIFIGQSIKFDDAEFIKKLNELIDFAEKNDVNIKTYIKELVPTYNPKVN